MQRILVCAVAGWLLAVLPVWLGPARAQTIVDVNPNPNGPHPPAVDAIGDYDIEPAQSFTTPAGFAWHSVSFSFISCLTVSFDVCGANFAPGTAYLLNAPYLGAPNGLSSSTPGYLGSTVGYDGSYNFKPSVTLRGATKYYLYVTGATQQDFAVPANGTTPAATLSIETTSLVPYPGGSFAAASLSGTSPYQTPTASNGQSILTAGFTVSASPCPPRLASSRRIAQVVPRHPACPL